MFDKYEVKSYPDYLQIEESVSDNENEKSTLKSKKTYYMNNKKDSDNSFQPECIIIRNNNNTAFYQSDSKNNYRGRKSLNQNVTQEGYNFTNRKKAGSLPPQNYIEEKFSYHYTNEEDNKKYFKNNKISPSNQRIYVIVDPFLNQTNKEAPRRTIKSIQNQFDVERNENFKVLSYRPEDNESSSNMNGKSKIIQIFKKQDVGELFFPSKRAQSPPSSAHSTDRKQQKLLSYQTPTLKFQSFFGSFTKSKNSKNNSQTKSQDKPKKNQLEDFNIDKLIEIGDNYSKKLIPILSFGKKVKCIKNKMKNRTNLNKNRFENNQKSCDKILKHMKDDRNEQKDMIGITKIYEQKEQNMYRNINKSNNNINYKINHNINDNINNNENGNRMSTSKNIVYHGQIKRKRNCHKNTKTFNNNEQNKDFIIRSENNYNNEEPNINQNININKELNNNNNNKRRIIISKIKRRTVKPNHKVLEYFHNNMNNPNENQTYHQITPTKVIQNKKLDLTVNNNNKTNYSINNNINNYHNNNILEKNNFINNCKMMTDKNIPKGEKSKKILLTEQEDIYNNNLIEKNKNIKKDNEEENYKNKKYSKINSNPNNQISKRKSDKNFKSKNYYGYDEANNMEGAINNHSYFESVYTRKKGLQKNISIDKINN